MSYSISTLLIRSLRDVFGENEPARRRAAIDEIYNEDCVFYDPTRGVCSAAETRSIASQARSGSLTLTFNISPLPPLRSWVIADGLNGYLAALVRRQLTPGLISLLLGTAGLPPFIFFLTNHSGRSKGIGCKRMYFGKSVSTPYLQATAIAAAATTFNLVKIGNGVI